VCDQNQITSTSAASRVRAMIAARSAAACWDRVPAVGYPYQVEVSPGVPDVPDWLLTSDPRAEDVPLRRRS